MHASPDVELLTCALPQLEPDVSSTWSTVCSTSVTGVEASEPKYDRGLLASDGAHGGSPGTARPFLTREPLQALWASDVLTVLAGLDAAPRRDEEVCVITDVSPRLPELRREGKMPSFTPAERRGYRCHTPMMNPYQSVIRRLSMWSCKRGRSPGCQSLAASCRCSGALRLGSCQNVVHSLIPPQACHRPILNPPPPPMSTIWNVEGFHTARCCIR